MADKRGSEYRTEAQREAFFKKGKSGNPGGKPKAIREAIEHAKSNFGLMLDTLKDIALDETKRTSDRIMAIKEYNDRAVGKPTQAIKQVDDDDNAVPLPVIQVYLPDNGRET